MCAGGSLQTEFEAGGSSQYVSKEGEGAYAHAHMLSYSRTDGQT